MGPIERDILTTFPFCGTDATLIWIYKSLVRFFSNLSFYVGNTRRVSDSFTYVHNLFRMYLSHDTQQWGHFNVEIDTTSRKNKYELKIWCNGIRSFNVDNTRCVFWFVHKLSRMSELLELDCQRRQTDYCSNFFHMMFRYCTSDHMLGQHPRHSVVFTCKHVPAKACIHASTQLRMQETIAKFLIRFYFFAFALVRYTPGCAVRE